MATRRKAEAGEATKTIAWFPPYTDDRIDFRRAAGVEVTPETENEDHELILYRPGTHVAPRGLRAAGRTVVTLPETVADNYLTSPTMNFREVEADADPVDVNPHIAGIVEASRPPAMEVMNADHGVTGEQE